MPRTGEPISDGQRDEPSEMLLPGSSAMDGFSRGVFEVGRLRAARMNF